MIPSRHEVRDERHTLKLLFYQRDGLSFRIASPIRAPNADPALIPAISSEKAAAPPLHEDATKHNNITAMHIAAYGR